jgi:predicted  nucleic acid-binding Zn-ribbon protein
MVACQHCESQQLFVQRHIFKDQSEHLRGTCQDCGLVSYLRRTKEALEASEDTPIVKGSRKQRRRERYRNLFES